MKKAHLRELRRITDSIPVDLIKQLTKTQDAYPVLKEIVTRGLADKKISKEDKKRFQAMLDSGYLDKKEEVIDYNIEKQISDYIEKEIEKAKKLGRLPKIAPKLILKKGKKYVNKRKAGVEQVSEGSSESNDR